MLHLAGLASSPQEGRARAESLVADGSALRRFESMVALQGGDLQVLKHNPAHRREFRAPRSGYLFSMDTTAVGWAVQRLGAGRTRPGEPVSPHAGLEMHAKIGAQLRAGEPIFTLFTEDPARFDEPERLLAEALVIADAPPRPTPLVHEVLTRDTLTSTVFTTT